MADSINPSGSKSTSSNLLPKYYRTDSNKKFLQATVDQLIQPGTVKKTNGFIGRQNAKSATKDNIFISAADPSRQHYQLEPGLIVKDSLDNTTFFKDYQDYINQLGVFGANTTNHSRINKQEFYSWNPHIDWDKFVNFQNYYWLPYGPDVIKIPGVQQGITSTYKVEIKAEADNNTYVFYPNGTTPNPTIKLYRGQTYRFEVSSPANPFSIKTARTVGTVDRIAFPFNTGNGTEAGIVEFTIPYNSPDLLYYLSENDLDLGGVFEVLSIDENTVLDINTEIIGKKTYQLSTGQTLSNGMKVSFIGQVSPASYATGQYYVEGVGDSIQLVNESTLELLSPYTSSESILFDSSPFDSKPFSDATTFAGKPDYIVVNRSSADHNPWSRYNRWFHKDTIEDSATYNGKVPSMDQSARAVRPIIEFEPNLKLYNFGTTAIADIDLIDTYTTDVFSNIEGQFGYNVDGIDLAQGMRILFTAETDIRVKNKIYKVDFLTLDGVRQIHLTEESEPVVNRVVLVRQGVKNQGQIYWYSGTSWNLAQQKTALNQPPLFDVLDSNGNSYGDKVVYDGTTFVGTPLFSYKVGTGTNDSTLGFPLSYKNINNVGDIVFNFNLATDVFQYKDNFTIISKCVNTGYLLNTSTTGDASYVNGWQTSAVESAQGAVRIYKDTAQVNNFNIDVFDNINQLTDLIVKVYVNGIRLDSSNWTIINAGYYKQVVLTTDITASDILTIKTYSAQPINSNGYYEIPINLQNNPLNSEIGDFTLGEVKDHVASIVDNLPADLSTNNIRDLGNITKYGTRFVQHSGPMSLSLYHITSDTNNVIRAIEKSRDDYNKFKRNFISVADSLGVETDVVKQVNLILQEINKDKPKTFPYYFTDMIPFNGSIRTDLTVVDYRIKTYPLTTAFNLDELSNKAVLVYLNGEQLLYKKDYTFDPQGFIIVLATIANKDIITTYEFDNTNGSFVPATPTKLGIWPKYEPKIYLDSSLVTPREMIQGHDGSQVLAYGDFRDDLILELEKRIYNNIKISYNPEIFDVHKFVPSYVRPTDYSLSEFDEVLSSNFYTWTNIINRDFSTPLSYNSEDSRTFNYRNLATPDGVTPLPGYWKGIHRWMLDTDRPNICPWEMLGMSEEPSWWQTVYGPAPYTSNNLILWKDLSAGLVREPGKPLLHLKQYERPFLETCIPVDENGDIVSPLFSGLARGTITNSTAGDFVFGDVSPVESAWRRSSHYAFSMLINFTLLQPSSTFGTLLDRSRIVRNLAGQLIYKDTGLRITPKDVVLPSIYSSTTDIKTSGIINYIVDYILSDNLKSYAQYQYDLQYITARLSHRIGGFTSKEKFNLLLDSKTPLTSGSVFVPQEDYDVILNSSSPIKKITYSAVIISKSTDGYVVKGYSKTQPYFKYYPYTKAGLLTNIGGISEGYTLWSINSQYAANKVIAFSNRYYRVKTLHTTTDTFNPAYYQLLPALPVVGGRDAYIRTAWDKTDPLTVPYGTKFKDVQDVVDFLLGYGEWLKVQGFVFDSYNAELATISNWETSAKEFMFWTTQNWSTGEDQWEDWSANQPVAYGAIVKYNGEYYRASSNVEPDSIFVEDDYTKLDGLSSIGSSVISLSPAASALIFSTPLSVVDDIRNPFNGYEIFKVDGTPIAPNLLNNYREDNTVSYTPVDDGIYGATFYLIQKEQVVILNNATLFNDTIYNPESGYRQEKIKVSGYVSSEWNGDFNIPGFIFDQAIVQEWDGWKDYQLGDIIKHKQFYYSAKSFVQGTQIFNTNDWIKLDKKPSAQLLPNWSYKASQFEDFYSLDSDNFDSNQQKVAQHLIGYQKRQYLENIIKDDVSEFKFYQGMIIEKGTQNVLNKLFDVLSADGKESIKFYEEWALRVGQYGASSAFENIEFIINEQEVNNNPQGFELVNQKPNGLVDFISRQTPNDVYLKPIGYNSNPWPLTTSSGLYLRTPGYVRSSDVKLTLKYLDDVLTYDVSDFKEGDYVWVGFEGREWNVYRYTNVGLKITGVVYANKQITVTFDKNVTFNEGSIIAIDQAHDYTGFFKVVSSTLRSVVVTADFKTQPKDFIDFGRATVGALNSQRASIIDVADQSMPQRVNNGELLWTDNAGDGKWATWQYNPAYIKSEIVNSTPEQGLGYGRQVVLNTSGNIAVISNSKGELVVYDKASPLSPWLQRQSITVPFISKSGVFGSNPTPDSATGAVLAMSSDSQWLATGTPTASLVCSKYKGTWSSSISYAAGEIVLRNSKPYVAVIIGLNRDPLTTVVAYNNKTGSSVIGTGSGAVFNVTATNSNYSAEVVNGGANYKVGDTIRIFGSDVGGDAPANNVLIRVVSIVGGSPSGAIARINVSGNARIYWNKLSYIPVDSTGSNNNGFENQGVVSIYKKDANNIFSLVDTILSPLPAAGELFGSTLVFGNNKLFVGANGYNSNKGIVYEISYQTTVEASTSYNPIGSTGTIVVLASTADIKTGMYLKGTGFNSNQYVAQVNGATSSIIISAAPDSEPLNIIEFTVTNWAYDSTITTTRAYTQFGSVMATSTDNSVLLITAPGDLAGVAPGLPVPGIVYVYKLSNGDYSLAQTIIGDELNFGLGIAVSNNGKYIAISSIYADGEKLDQGRVTVFETSDIGYVFYQNLYNLKPETGEFFGTKIAFMNDADSIVVYSQGADNYTNVLFDNGTTSFDNNLTKIIERADDSGRVDIYDKYNKHWIFSESLNNQETAIAGYCTGFAVGPDQVFAGTMYALDQGLISGKTFEYRKLPSTKSWTILHKENDRVDLSRIKRAFLYNKVTNKLLSYLDVIDSTQGRIPGIADQEIKFKTYYDPATYASGTGEVNVDEGMAWTKPYVGTLWWDLRTAKFFDSHDTSLVYRNSTWNTIFPGASIDVYEWVETKLTPNQWNELADTEAGITAGVSGTSLYSNDVYSVIRKYDNVSKAFKNTYYYWVKNKKITPNVVGRKISAQDVVDLIENPRGYGYKYLALTGSNSFSLVNVKNLLQDQDVVLSVEYWTSPYTDKNIHSQWKIINNNSATTLPKAIEQKWFDSLCGKDSAGRLVPDPALPAKLKYGVESRPRQSMFVNRFEALKQFIEAVNFELVKHLIVENRDTSALESYEKQPSIISGLYDNSVDTDSELRFANIGTYSTPKIKPIITDGRITGVTVNQRGNGYLIAPYLTVSGTGQGAVIRANINVKGQITGATVISVGEGYDTNTVITVRNYSILVKQDSTAEGMWSIYAYEPSTQTWSRVQSQAYDVRNYWNYVDWYSTGYTASTAIDHSVNSLVQLSDLETKVGQLVKIRTTSLGTWALLEKYADSASVDWTQSYKVIGREKGTIQFSTSLYEFTNTLYGFDGSLYDSSMFDNSASTELKIILSTLKDKILVDDLKQIYLDLFFASVRYAYSEQNYVDWIFKTSFVKAQHSVGELTQKVTYNNDNLSNFEDYINEVKPYRTKIREYVSAYDKLDTSSVSTTDFDLPSVVENGSIMPITTFIVGDIINSDNNKVTQYPWKHWYDNLGFSVNSIQLVNGGSSYRAEPVVRFISETGTGAIARAFITNGKVNRIQLLASGSGYLSAPTIIIDGGTTADGVAAKAVAIIGSGVVRSNKVNIKFDRITQKYFITQLEQTETFFGTGSKLQFALTWAPDVQVGKSLVLVNNVEVLRSSYKLSIIKSTTKGYTSHSGAITFDTSPANGVSISVSYIKDWSMLTAADRIQYYYNPAVGELGKDLAQLMTGVDYGGVNVYGLNFEISAGWGSLPFYSDKWDSFDSTFEDYITNVVANTHSFTLPYVPSTGTEMNVYYSGKNSQVYTSDGFTKIYNFNVYDVYPPAVTITRTIPAAVSATNIAGSFVLKLASVIGIEVDNVVTTYWATGRAVATATAGRYITLTSTTGLAVGEQITFKGTKFGGLDAGKYFITNIVSGNRITVSVVRGGTSYQVTTGTGTMDFSVINAFGYNTKVVSINTVTNQVTLDQILFKDIPAATDIVFNKTLIDPTDCLINPNGTVFLNDPIPAGSVIDITAYFAPVRLDDLNYNTTGVARALLTTYQNELAVIIADYNILQDQKAIIENDIENFSTELYSLQSQLNALNIAITGMSPSNPAYPGLVSQINILVNTDIPSVESDLAIATNDLTTVNNEISIKNSEKIAKQAQVVVADNALTDLPAIQNETAIMQTIISDGIPDNILSPTTKTFAIPNTFNVFTGDKFIWRKSSSDGSVATADTDYDTALSGGAFLGTSLTSATGIAAEDIIIDGDGFVTPTTSPATEEVVPGQVVDAVAIKVYDRSPIVNASIKVDSYIGDGITTNFVITQQPNSPTAVLVKFTQGARDLNNQLSSVSTIQTLVDDYTIDYKNSIVKFITPPPVGEVVSLFSFGFNGDNILDLDYFVGDGTTTEFITKAPWLENVNYLVYVNGLPAQPGTPALFKTDSTYDSANRAGLAFSIPPTAGALINYIIVSGREQSFSVTKTERIQGTGATAYDLAYQIGDALPLESYMLVRVNQTFLKGPNNSYYKIKGNQLTYNIDPAKFLPYSVSATDIFVYANGVLLTSGVDYTVEIGGINVKIAQSIRQTYLNKELIISIKQEQGYVYIPPAGIYGPRIQFSTAVTSNDVVEVISGYKHDILDIQATAVNVTSKLSITPDTTAFYNYRGVAGGVIQLDRAVLDDNYVWLYKNGILLTPSIDFKLNENKLSLTLALYPDPEDEFNIVTFGGSVSSSGISYMQFKDMLNRLHFKRLNANKQTVLVTDLKYIDTSIEVLDASNFDAPSIANNKPGIIEIRGERIEFFTLIPKVVGPNTTYLLGQLRRGTLGTGTPKLHKIGAFVQEIGASETLPYIETVVTEQVKSDGTNIVPLTFVPAKVDNTVSWFADFGLTLRGNFNSMTTYSAKDVAIYNNLYYKCIQSIVASAKLVNTIKIPTNNSFWELYTVIPATYGQADEIEVFVGGYASLPWVPATDTTPGVTYKIDNIVEVGSYTYRCITEHTSSKLFNTDKANWVFFVGNIRLKKKPYTVYNVNQAAESPAGDVLLDAEFAVDGITNQLRLTNKLDFGTRVTVIKRNGVAWDSTTSILDDTSKIAKFLKAAPGIWYTSIGKYENKTGVPSTFDSVGGTFDNNSITFDQG